MRSRLPAALAALALLPGVLMAQVPGVPEVPTEPDTAAAADSADAYRRMQAEAGIVVPVMPRIAAESPQPPLSRIIISRDSIDVSGALTVGDLLARVPGVYLWRGGGIGRPELVNFRGRGTASAEYFLDDIPYLPAGPDSLSVDATLLPLA
ncbi:MAG TPA: TonB-dependent receptor plug domain-containing protein, partial [Gemmatimonadales bacterium]|nr:TonB-dependent receptor plug domain-containing protein [Gemmatimonadales bacterium]